MTLTPYKSNKSYEHFKQLLIEKALSLNICSLSIVNPNIVNKYADSFTHKISKGIPEDLNYLTQNIEVRRNPCLILPNCKSIICAALSYNNLDTNQIPSDYGNISTYARGRDYHKTFKNKMNQLGNYAKEIIPELNYRAITDSAPFFEQYATLQAQNGIKGRNGLVRFHGTGSKIFLAELLLDVDLGIIDAEQLYPSINALACPDNCNICLKACPTKALSKEQFKIERCISYLTIENKGTIPLELRESIGNHIYGCDECQNCCPHNKVSITSEPDFINRFNLKFLKLNNLLTLTEEQFKTSFAGTPVYRIGYTRLMRNILVAAGNAPKGTVSLELISAQKNKHPMLDEIVDWALCKQFSKK